MRYQGKITNWKDEQGFGFITPNGTGTQIFVHQIYSEKPRPSGRGVKGADCEAVVALPFG
jgi:hypothetical protein